MEKSASIDFLMDNLGDFGSYQLRQFLLHLLSAFTAGLHMMVLTTVAAVPDYKCIQYENHTGFFDDDFFITDECKITNVYNQTIKCEKWEFDNTYHEHTRATQWNMICDNRWMGCVAQSSYMFGVFTGAVVLGSLADKFGRKKIFCISAVAQLILSVGVAFLNNYWVFIATTYVYGIFGSSGSYISGFVLTMELVGPTKRSVCGILFQTIFASGIMAVSVWGYFIRNTFVLQIIYALHSLILIPHFWLIDESPRWLWGQGRKDEAIIIIQKALKTNNKPAVSLALEKEQRVSLSLDNDNDNEKESHTNQSFSILDLFKTPSLRKNTILICYFWFAASFGYYGISLRTSKLKGNPYFMLFLMAAIELPSYVFVTLSMDRLGRRFLNSSMMIIGGTALLISAFLPPDSLAQTISTTVVFLGKFCIAGAFAIIYNYTVERFPTVVRNTAIGLGSMFARLAGSFTPFVGLMDSFDERTPIITFALVTLFAGILCTLLPETLNTKMPQTMQDGEDFGKGDTCFSTGCFGSSKKQQKEKDIPLESY
ncbi:Major facilitator superfamily domain,Major facilitator, sugar transporter-like [Cinara cedri]|uniref:Major facilitator superfamily domain,Major facilitator, sugar transporter-like n=1 Tax=Cinara cedri TaxID=506608 RepID=A0A5E4N6U8_9HEMI|nr:Major facilitator superfamily domain,Major facilitator, sugar transporter-like [Cinara cedri]